MIKPYYAVGFIGQWRTLFLQEDGSYAGFDEEELTSQSGGKARAARLIKVP